MAMATITNRCIRHFASPLHKCWEKNRLSAYFVYDYPSGVGSKHKRKAGQVFNIDK